MAPERFYAVLQGGEGCDYSIGCGTKVVPLSAEDWELAEEQAHKLYEDHGGNENVSSVEILCVTAARQMDLATWRLEKEAAEQLRERDKDRAEFERLAGKLGITILK